MHRAIIKEAKVRWTEAQHAAPSKRDIQSLAGCVHSTDARQEEEFCPGETERHGFRFHHATQDGQ